MSSGYVQSNAIGNTYVNPGAGAAATYNLTPQESGKVTFIGSTAVAASTPTNINLGVPMPGLHYKLIYNGLVATRLTANVLNIVSNNAGGAAQTLLSVSVMSPAATPTGSSAATNANNTTLTIATVTGGATGACIGDTYDCYSDGNLWYIYANVLLAGGLTIV